MKPTLIRLLSLTLLLSTSFVYAEIYSWVDKDGKKHFGQEVPKEYAKKSTVIDVKSVNVMDETKVSPPPRTTNKTTYQQTHTGQDDSYENLSSCEQKKRAYEESVACYADCRLPKEESGGRVNNVSACRHCVDAKKPNC
jgi:hypothetical protein